METIQNIGDCKGKTIKHMHYFTGDNFNTNLAIIFDDETYTVLVPIELEYNDGALDIYFDKNPTYDLSKLHADDYFV